MSTPGDTPDGSDPGARAEFDREHGIDRHVEDPTLHEPVMIVMLTGWIDAAGAAALMQQQPSVIKRPVVQWPQGRITVGFAPDAWAELAHEGKR